MRPCEKSVIVTVELDRGAADDNAAYWRATRDTRKERHHDEPIGRVRVFPRRVKAGGAVAWTYAVVVGFVQPEHRWEAHGRRWKGRVYGDVFRCATCGQYRVEPCEEVPGRQRTADGASG
jgi:hypothetical protein